MSSPKNNVSPASPANTPDPTQVHESKPLPKEELKDLTSGQSENKVTCKAATTRHEATPNSASGAPDDRTAGDGQPRQWVPFAEERFFAEIIAGTPLKEAAELVGFSERTAQRRWADPDFQERFLHEQEMIRDEVHRQLVQGMKQAVKALRTCVNDDNLRLKLSAARALLKFGHLFASQNEQCRALDEAMKRLEALQSGNDRPFDQ